MGKSNKYENPLYARTSERSSGRFEVTKDFILPDSYADIKKILYTFVCLRPGHNDVNSGKLMCDGTVVCRVLFVNDDGELSSVDFNLDYQNSVTLDKPASDTALVCMPVIEGISAKAINPRKVGLRANLNMCMRLWEAVTPCAEAPAEFNTEDELSIERLEEKLMNLCGSVYSDTDKEISEDIEIDRSGTAIDEIIMSDVTVNINNDEARESNGAMTVKGTVNVDILYRDINGKAVYKNVSLPFSQTVDLPDAPENAVYIARAYIEKASALPAENSFGEMKIIELDFTYSVYVYAFSECESMVSVDAYSTAFNTENIGASLRYSSARPYFSYSDSRSVGGSSAESAEYVCSFARAYVEQESSEPEVVCTVTVITTAPNGGFSAEQLTDSVRLSPDDFGECYANAEINSLQCVCEAGKIKASYNLSVRAVGWKNNDYSYVSALKLSENKEGRTRKPLTLYYPSIGETLWDAAKKYRVSRGALMKVNSIENANEIRRALIIPGKRR